MRRDTQFVCIFLLLFLSFFISAAYADDTEQEAFSVGTERITPDKSLNTEEKSGTLYFDPDLESILAVNDRSRYAFLSRLTPNEQRELARMIKQRVDDEAGVTVSIMAIVSGFVPAFISAQFADKLEPATVARISDKVSVKKAIAIAKHLEPAFLADVAVYQDPDKVIAVVEGLPDKDLVEITRILFSREEYRVVAKFSDGLSVEKLRDVSEKIDDPATLIAIARKMKNRDNAVQTAIGLSDDYLFGFLNLLSSDDDYQLAAAVGAELEVSRQVRMLNRLEPEKAARLAAHYPPGTIARIMGDTMDETIAGISEQQLLDVSHILIKNKQYQVVAEFSDALDVETLKAMAEKINAPASLIEIARHMKHKEKIVNTAMALSDDYLLDFMGLLSDSNDYELAAVVGRGMDVDRQLSMLNRLDPEKAARLAAHYPPEAIARIMEKADNEKMIRISRHLSPEAMAHVAGAMKPQALNRLIGKIEKRQILAALPYIDLMTIKAAWPGLTAETRKILQTLGKEYAPLAEAIAAVK